MTKPNINLTSKKKLSYLDYLQAVCSMQCCQILVLHITLKKSINF